MTVPMEDPACSFPLSPPSSGALSTAQARTGLRTPPRHNATQDHDLGLTVGWGRLPLAPGDHIASDRGLPGAAGCYVREGCVRSAHQMTG